MHRESNDKKMLEYAEKMKEMLSMRRFDNLMGPKVPFMKDGVLNLLQVADLDNEQKHHLIRMGFGDILQHGNLLSDHKRQDQIDF